jgi:glycosyltransferase involved in cell wall biosynthesis
MSEAPQGTRIAIFSRYNLADQYDLAAEFQGMLTILAARHPVLHLSLSGPQRDIPVPPNVTVEEIPLHIDRQSPGGVLLKTMLMYLYLPSVVRHLRRFKPGLIFISEMLPLYGLFLKVFCRTRVAVPHGDLHFHNMLGRKLWSRPILKMALAFDRSEARRIDGFFCRATGAGERLVSWGVRPELVRVVRDAPDPEAFYPRDQHELRKQCGFAEDDVVLLYHGVMHQGKGLDKLLRWTADLYKENPKVGIILVGGGPEEGALRSLAADLGLGERAVFTGWLKTVKEVGDYCNAADICIAMRTADEANERIVPGALLHSMACRKVVVGPALSGIGEIITHGENGYLFKPDDGEDFKRLIRELIEHREQWGDVSERAYRDIMDNYSVQAAAEGYAAALEHFAFL